MLRIAGVLVSAWPGALPAHPGHALAQLAPPRVSGDPLRTVPPGGIRADALLSVSVRDAATGRPTPVRVRIIDASGKPLGPVALTLPRTSPAAAEVRLAAPGSVVGLPREAIGVMYGANDSAQGYAFQPNGAFYVSGSFEMPVPAGTYFITISKGYEFVQQTEELTFRPGDRLVRTYDLGRWIDMPKRGWYSADDHVHLRRSPRENPLILDWMAAEDVHVGTLLQMGDFWTTYFSQYAWGEKGRYRDGNYTLASGQEEPRTHELGHTISLGAGAFVRFPDDYFLYDKYFDRVHELGGVTGYAHQGMMFHGYRGMTLDVLAGKIDFLELVQFCSPRGPLAVEHYYRFLDLGYKLTALAGSDFPWCGRGLRRGEEDVGPQIGNARFYTHVGGPLSFDRWLQAVKAGHTFVTTGPVIEFTVNGRLPGSSLDLRRCEKLKISATARGHRLQIPLQRLQVIGHRTVLAEARADQEGQSADCLTVEFELEAGHGLWIAARADAGPSQVAHTTPVYVTVDGDGFHNRSNAIEQIDASKRYLEEIRELLQRSEDAPVSLRADPSPSRYRGTVARLHERITEAESTLEGLRHRR